VDHGIGTKRRLIPVRIAACEIPPVMNHIVYIDLPGRGHPPGSSESAAPLDQAVDYLRRAGPLEFLARALLARGTPHDLAEVFRIAARSGMRLYFTDYHLAMARLHHSRDHFLKAAALIAATGYHRRDAELAALRHTLAFPASTT
jgi:hypothetical protein